MWKQGFRLYLYGRVRGVTRDRIARAVEAAGGRLVRRPGSRVDIVALGASSALVALADAPPIRLPEGIPPTTHLVSEEALKRHLAIAPGKSSGDNTLSAADLARASRIDAETMRCAGLYDVFDGDGDTFTFRDLRAAREIRRLLDLGFGLDEIVEAAIELRRSGRGLFDTSLADGPWGEIVQEVAGRIGRLDGQYALPLEETWHSVDELFEQAEECEAAEDWAGAERFYRTALQVDRSDPVIPFNLGNVLEAQGRTGEALLAYERALARDPAFAEAWINMAAIHQNAGRAARAELCLKKALEAQPQFGTALHNLALLLSRGGRYREAAPLWSRFLATSPPQAERAAAARWLMMCRLETERADRGPASGER
jgi:hypothetical protein